MNQVEQMQALIGDKLLDVILYEEMSKRMPNLSVSNIITIRHRLASNLYLSNIWNIMYRDDFIDNYSIHEKGTMMEMQLTKAYQNGNNEFIQRCIKELLWYDVYVQFVESKKFTQCNSTQTNISNNKGEIKSIHVQASVKIKTKEIQTSQLINIENKQVSVKPEINHQEVQTIIEDDEIENNSKKVFKPTQSLIRKWMSSR